MNVAFANSSPRRYRWDAVALGISMLVAGIVAVLVRPSAEPSAHPVLARLVPVSFGEWTAVPDSTVRVIDPSASSPYDPDADHPYSDVLMRTYSNSRGDVVQLALAYGQEQKQEVKIHRPAPCYMAQGFEILAHSLTTILLRGAAPVSGARMLPAGSKPSAIGSGSAASTARAAGRRVITFLNRPCKGESSTESWSAYPR